MADDLYAGNVDDIEAGPSNKEVAAIRARDKAEDKDLKTLQKWEKHVTAAGYDGYKYDYSIFAQGLDEEELLKSESWLHAAKVAYDMDNGEGAWDEKAKDLREDGRSEEEINENLAQEGLAIARANAYNNVYKGLYALDMSVYDDTTPEQKDAFNYLKDSFDHKAWTGTGLLSAAKETAMDPTSWVGAGLVWKGATIVGGKVAGYILTKFGDDAVEAGAKFVANHIVQRVATAASGGAIGSTEGYVWAGGDSVAMQNADRASGFIDKIDYGEAHDAGKMVAVFSSVLGTVAPELVGLVTRKLGKKVSDDVVPEKAADAVQETATQNAAAAPADSVTGAIVTDAPAANSAAPDNVVWDTPWGQSRGGKAKQRAADRRAGSQ